MNTDTDGLVPRSSDDGEICSGAYVADADFEMFVPLVSKAEARSGVLLKAEEVLWLISEPHGLNCGWGCQEGGKVGTTPRTDQGNTFGICVRHDVISNAPADHPKRVCMGLFALNPKVEQKAGGDERHEDQCALLLHRVGHCGSETGGFK